MKRENLDPPIGVHKPSPPPCPLARRGLQVSISHDPLAKFWGESGKVETIDITCCIDSLKRLDILSNMAEKCSGTSAKVEILDFMVTIIKDIKLYVGR